MSSSGPGVPETQQLYSPEEDAQAREAGLVYIEDLALSGVMIALKTVCAPVELGFLKLAPIDAQTLDELHKELVTGVGKVTEKPGLLSRLLQGEAAQRAHHESEKDYLQFSKSNGEVEVSVGNSGYWDGRPFQIRRFTADESLDPVRLTGFDPFDPRLFDDYQETPGVAQRTIDALRRTGDPLSIEVGSNEAGRTLARAKALSRGIGPGTNPELAEAFDEAIRPMRDLFDR